jgi:hypothetical protein
MVTRALPAGSRPTCAAPEWLPVVDAAFARPGGPAAERLRRVACPECPVNTACLLLAVRGAEHGTWAGTSAKWRTEHGGLTAGPATNLRGVDHH